MALGLVCHWLDEKDNNLLKCKELRLGNFEKGTYDNGYILGLYTDNVANHAAVLPKIISSGIRCMRMTSSMFSLHDKVRPEIVKSAPVVQWLKQFGEIVLKANLRLTFHPGQFCSLSSERQEVVQNSIVELAHHAWIFDCMGLPQTTHHAINIHGGKRSRTDQLVDVVNTLPTNIKDRLTFENDESSYNVPELMKVHERTGVPVVWDSHHHTFNDGGLTAHDAAHVTMGTWGKVKPLQHISNTEPGLEGAKFGDRRKHSQYIHTIPEVQLNLLREDKIDCDIEAKMKNKAVFDVSKKFLIPL